MKKHEAPTIEKRHLKEAGDLLRSREMQFQIKESSLELRENVPLEDILGGFMYALLIEKLNQQGSNFKPQNEEGIINRLTLLAQSLLDEQDSRLWLIFSSFIWRHIYATAILNREKADSTNPLDEFIPEGDELNEQLHFFTEVFALDVAQSFINELNLENMTAAEIDEMLGVQNENEITQDEGIEEVEKLNVESMPSVGKIAVSIGSSTAYHQAVRAISLGSKWSAPENTRKIVFDLSSRNKRVRGAAYIQTPEAVYGDELSAWQTRSLEIARKQLDDLTADVFDALMVEWLKKAQSANEAVFLPVDLFLEYRGLKPKIDEKGYTGGYHKKHKDSIGLRLEILADVFVKFDELHLTVIENGKRKQKKYEGEAPLVLIEALFREKKEDGTKEIYGYKCRPGLPIAMGLYGEGRQTALLSEITLHLDPYRYKYAKRMIRYFAYLWRVRQSNADYTKGVKISTLMQEIGLEVDKKNPARTREQLELSLDKLKNEGAITHWEYEDITELPIRGWINEWLDWKISVEPPTFIMEHYQNIKTIKPKEKEEKKELAPGIGMVIRNMRKERGVSLAVAAEQMGIAKGMLSLIENGKQNPGAKVRPKIEKWMNEPQ